MTGWIIFAAIPIAICGVAGAGVVCALNEGLDGPDASPWWGALIGAIAGALSAALVIGLVTAIRLLFD